MGHIVHRSSPGLRSTTVREDCERKAKKVNNNKNENGGGQKENHSVERSNQVELRRNLKRKIREYRHNSVRMLTLQVQSYRSVIWLAKSGGPTRVPETGIVAHGPKRTGALRTGLRLQSSVCDHLIVPKLPSAQAPTHSPAYSRH